MELSSDMDRRQMADEDIEIDLDFTGDQPLDGEDDYMAEDVNLATDEAPFDRQLAQGGKDDEMLDDEYSLQEAEDHSSVHDEDLGDAVYPVLEETVDLLAESTSEHNLEHIPEWADDTLQGQEIGVTVNDNHPQPDLRSDHSESNDATLSRPPVELILDARSAAQGDDDYETQEPLHHLDSIHKLPSEVNPTGLQAATATVTGNIYSDWGSTTPKDEDEGQTHSPVPEDRIATSDEFETRNEIASAIATYIHPVAVVYQDSEMSLFPPTDEDQEHSQTYLLHDESLASESIMNLFGACRLVLADSIEEDDELEITIGVLGLEISEVGISRIQDFLLMLTILLQSATECASTTLAQIIDLYVQLQKHDGFDSPAPLYLVLSTKVKFSHRFDYLLSAVAEGKGLSQLMPLESAEVADQHSDNRLEQGDTQGSYPSTPKPNSGAELTSDPPGDIDADEDAEEEPDLTHQQLEDLKPNPESYEVGGQTDIAPAEKQVIENHGSQTEENQTKNGSSDAFNGDPNNVHQVGDPPKRPYQPDLNAIPIANKDQNAVDERDLIYFEDEDKGNPGSSTGSSTIQGDVREVTVDSSNQVSGDPTSATKEENVAKTSGDLESNRATVLNGRSSTPSFLTDAIEDDFDYAAHIETTEDRPSDYVVHGEDQKLEDDSEHHLKVNSAIDPRGYGQDPKEVRSSTNVPEQESHVSVQSSFDEDPNSSNTLTGSNIGTKSPRKDLTEIDIQRNAGRESLVSVLDGENILEYRHTIVDSNGYVYNNTTDSLEGDQNATDGFLTRQYEDDDAFDSTFENLRSTRNTQEQLTDNDEITYEDEDDCDEPELSNVDGSKQNSNLSPGLLKRVRSDHEDQTDVKGNVQGTLNSLVPVSQLIAMQPDAKRHRSG